MIALGLFLGIYQSVIPAEYRVDGSMLPYFSPYIFTVKMIHTVSSLSKRSPTKVCLRNQTPLNLREE